MDEFIGIIKLFAGNFAPRGWMFCQGQTLPIAQNSALFALLGTTYGGDGVRTFKLPDLRGRVPIGFGQGPGLSDVVQGQASGSEKVALLGSNLPQTTVPVQINGLKVSSVGAGATVKIPVSNNVDEMGANSPAGGFLAPHTSQYAFSSDAVYGSGAISVNLGELTASGNATISIGGSSAPVPIMQPSLGLNYIICLNGVYPSRD